MSEKLASRTSPLDGERFRSLASSRWLSDGREGFGHHADPFTTIPRSVWLIFSFATRDRCATEN